MVSILPALGSLRERKQEIDLGDNSPYVRKFKAVLDSGFHSVDYRFQVLDFSLPVKLPIVNGFHTPGFGFNKQNILGFRIRIRIPLQGAR